MQHKYHNRREIGCKCAIWHYTKEATVRSNRAYNTHTHTHIVDNSYTVHTNTVYTYCTCTILPKELYRMKMFKTQYGPFIY